MKDLSKDLEVAISDSISGMTLDLDILKVDDDKLTKLMKSRTDSFASIKEMIVLWEASQNAPGNEKLRTYVKRLIKSGENTIDVLRQALRRKIDFEELDAEKHGTAIASKPVLFRAINEINSGVIELKLQLDSDKIDLKSREFQRGFPEKFANQEFFPEKDYYKEWYNEEEDAIMICPNGTKGEIITLDNLKIQLPAPPKNKKEILFYDLPQEEQYWKRPEPPTGLSPETEDMYTDYILGEFKRRREGCWFMNNGKPIWVTPAHYMGLVHNQMLDSGGYKDFRMAQCFMYYFSWACTIDPRCVGELFVKGRRTGFTEEIMDHLVHYSTSKKNQLIGMTSKTGDDAQEAFLKYSYTIQNLPFYFRPVVKGKIDDRNKMEFGKPSDNTKTAKKLRDTNTGDYLNTKVDWMNTTTLAYDSKKLNYYLGDECFEKGTKILMHDYTFKNIEEIKKGDFVRVEGDKVMEVGDTFKGIDDMYKIHQPYGKDYIVNSNHRLYLERRNAKIQTGFKTITPVEYLNSSYYVRRTFVRAISEGFEFPEADLPIDPYFLGLWLGDGMSNAAAIMVNPVDDVEISEYLYEYAEKNCMSVKVVTKFGDKGKCYHFKNKERVYANQTTGIVNNIKKELFKLNLINNKHIPEIYLKSSKNQRLKLLAGLIDSDGHYSGKSYSIGMSRKNLIDQIYTLCKITGIDVSQVKHKKTNFNSDSYHINVQKSNEIPCLVRRKKSTTSVAYKSRRLKMDVSYIGQGEYFGIQLIADNDDDRRLILEDYTISMNCGKWVKPLNYIDHWNNIRPTMVPGGVIKGKAFLGSTLNPLDKGGAEFQTLYYGSNVTKRNENGRTSTGLYSYFLPAHKNYEDYTDKYGICHEVLSPGEFFYNNHGVKKTQGSLQFLENEFRSAKSLGNKAYNNTRRLDPITIEDAFRDEISTQLLDVEKINQQLNYNRDMMIKYNLVRGNFEWRDGIPDTEVIWKPNEKGRFLIAWLPSKDMSRSKWEMKPVFGQLTKCPVNDDIGAMGCDPYDQTAVVDAKLVATENGVEYNLGSKGSMHGITGFNLHDVPSNYFFLEYIARPKDADTFFEDVLMACVFYSMPILVENNKKMLLKHFKVRGYRGFVLNRFDKAVNRLSVDEKELGGIPNNSADIINQHWTSIETYVNNYVGEYQCEEGETPIREVGEIGSMPFDRTLSDWLKFNIENRTKFDASISSGLALMAINRHKYKPVVEKKPIVLNFKRYS